MKRKPTPSVVSCSPDFSTTSQQHFSLIPDQYRPPTTNQPAIFFSHNELASATNNQPAEKAIIPAKILPSHELCRQFSFTKIKTATNNFDDSHLIIGLDGWGWGKVIYLGKIDGGATKVAINKHLYNSDFHLYIEVMSKLCHGNLVPLIGYCHYKREMLLVYEHMARESLCSTSTFTVPGGSYPLLAGSCVWRPALVQLMACATFTNRKSSMVT
jgi:hypothetical protein